MSKPSRKKENSAFEIFQQSLTETLDAVQQIRTANREKHYLRRVIDNARDVRQHASEFAWKVMLPIVFLRDLPVWF